MKTANYKMKLLKRFVYSSKEAMETFRFPEYVLRLQKER